MRERLNAEGHDESQYLPKKWINPKTGKEEDYPVVNVWRMGKGDIIINEDDKYEVPTWLPRRLFRNGSFTKELFDTSNSFFRILVHAKRTLGITDLRNILFEKPPASGQNIQVDMFIELKRALALPEMNAIIWLVWDDYNRGNTGIAYQIIGTIKHGLENCQMVIDKFKEKSDNESSTAPFLRPEFLL